MTDKKPRSQKVLRNQKRIETTSIETPTYAEMWTNRNILKMNGKLKKQPYQRKLIWDTKPNMKAELIVAILEREIISSCMLQETPSGTFYMLNCQQRFDAVKSFYKNEYAIPEKIDEERAGMKFKDLSEQEKKNFLDYEFLIQVQVSSNGKGLKAYKGAQLGFQHSKSEIYRADYSKNNFFKHIQAQLRKPLFKDFYNNSGVLTKGKIARCEDEDLMGESLLLEAYGACEGKEYKDKLEDFQRKPTLFNRFKKEQHENQLAKHIRTIRKIFPTGLEYQYTTKPGKDKKKKYVVTEKTRLGNKTAFYRLLGAIRMIDTIEGGHDIFSDAKCKRIQEKLPIFAKESGERGRKGIATGIQQRYYASTTRATTNKSIREIGITIIKDLIMSY